MCSRQQTAEQGGDYVAGENVKLLQTRLKKVLALEDLRELQLNEQIEVEDELANIIKSLSISRFISRHKR